MLKRIRRSDDYMQPAPGRIVVPIETKDTEFGRTIHVKVLRADGQRMAKTEALSVVAAAYPDRNVFQYHEAKSGTVVYDFYVIEEVA